MIYTIYSVRTGEPLRCITCNQEDLPIQIDPVVEACVVGRYSDATHYFENNAPVEKPPKPSDGHKFNYTSKQWEPDLARAVIQAKAQRSLLLSQSDWTQLPDVPLATKNAWAAYRQDLRDITGQPGYPLDVAWPVAPA